MTWKSSAEFLDLHPTNDPMKWVCHLGPGNLTPGQMLQGGAGLGAALEALVSATGRPVIWATAQYLAHAAPPHPIEIQLIIEVEGHHVTQARAIVTQDGREVLTTHAALGVRKFPHDGIWVKRPNVPAPQDCPSVTIPRSRGEHIFERIQIKRALGKLRHQQDGVPGPGNSAVYLSVPGGPRLVTVGDLALMADLLPLEFGNALGVPSAGNSLDNTIRLGARAVSKWVLLDVHIHFVHDGFGHGMAHMWADDGTYLGSASQSVTMRLVDHEGVLIRNDDH